MKFIVVASGSKGNSTLIVGKQNCVLIDMGISIAKLKMQLDKYNLSISDITGVFVSHCHTDHIVGLASLVKKYGIKVYATGEVYMDIHRYISIEDVIIVQDKYEFDDISVDIIKTSHDVASNGYIFTENDKSIVYITDTGYINKKYYNILSNRNVYIIEANHNEQLLLNGPYPFELKQRILSDKGHMSNEYTGLLLTKIIGNNTEKIILAHISENNNTYDLAYEEVKKYLLNTNFNIDNLIVAKQNESLELIEV